MKTSSKNSAAAAPAPAADGPVIKNRDLLNAIESINAVAALKIQVRTSFVIALNLREIREHVTLFEEQRKKILDKHTVKDADGVPKPVYVAENGPDGKPLVDKDGRPVEVKDKDGKVINKVIPGQVSLDDPKAFNADMEELVNIDVTKDIKLRQIKVSDVEGVLEPSHIVNLLWMFKED